MLPTRVYSSVTKTPPERANVYLPVQFGTIPLTEDDQDAQGVSFQENQHLTLEIDDDEFAVYLLSPQYQFNSAEDCNEFMSRIRERELLGSFLPREVSKSIPPAPGGWISRLKSSSSREQTLARHKIVRIWERNLGSRVGPLVTMTFHDRSKDPPNFREWSLKDFRETALPMRHGMAIELSRFDRDEQIFFYFECEL